MQKIEQTLRDGRFLLRKQLLDQCHRQGGQCGRSARVDNVRQVEDVLQMVEKS